MIFDANFLLLLIIAIAVQLLGVLLTWLLLHHFHGKIRLLLSIEIILMCLLVVQLLLESFETTLVATGGFFVGMLTILIAENLIPMSRIPMQKMKQMNLLVIIAMSVHELSEGGGYGASYALSKSAGITTAFLIALHNIPEASVVSMPYLIFGRLKEALTAVGWTQLAYFIGASAAYALLLSMTPEAKAFFVALAAGAIFYISITEWRMMKEWKAKPF